MGFFSSSGGRREVQFGERETLGEKNKERERAEKSKVMSNLVEPEAESCRPGSS